MHLKDQDYNKTIRERQNDGESIRWLDELHAMQQDLNDMSADLSQLASAFHSTGNSVVSDRLWVLADALRTRAENSRMIASMVVNENVRSSSEATTLMLKGILGGIKLGSTGEVSEEEAIDLLPPAEQKKWREKTS